MSRKYLIFFAKFCELWYLKKTMDKIDIAKIIDHTFLGADGGKKDIERICQEAKTYGFRGVCINSRWIKFAKGLLEGSDVKITTVIDYPLGASPHRVRLFQGKAAKDDGADELDLVLAIGSFKAGKYDEVLEDLKEIAKILPTKVIIETGYLTDEEIAKASQLVKASGCICVKTSTGWEPKTDISTKAEHIKIIRKTLPGVLIKASGGIRTLKDLKILVEAGADIIGTSASVDIMKEGEIEEKNNLS